MKRLFSLFVLSSVAAAFACSPKEPQKPVVLATTTSTVDTGLLDTLLPTFEKQSGLVVKTIAVGTGEALEMGRRGEADVLLVHAPEAEMEFVNKGHGRNRRAVMHNDFVIAGPETDPAGINGSKDAAMALKTIAEKKASWVSRGDRSGTHQKELFLWKSAGAAPGGEWFIETGQGMGATLQIADERNSYTLSDRGTFLAASNLKLKIMVEGDERLFNPYHVIEVVHERANADGGKQLADFLCLPSTQAKIREFKSNGRQLFIPEAEQK